MLLLGPRAAEVKNEGEGVWGEGGLELLAVGGRVSLGLILHVLQRLFVLLLTWRTRTFDMKGVALHWRKPRPTSNGGGGLLTWPS